MSTSNTTFTSLTSGTRDSRSNKGDIYFLNGNTTNGRLNISAGAKWLVGDNTRINVVGNPGHSYMFGEIEGSNLTYIGEPSAGGRFDFSSPDGGYKINNMSYIYMGNGSVFNHLEGAGNVFTGDLKFIIDMTGGDAYVQLNSREYANVTLDVKPSNAAEVTVYAARGSEGYTSLPNFKTLNISDLIIRAGSTGTSHGRIYDPVYDGVANNLISLVTNRDTGQPVTTAHETQEYFTLDVTNLRNDEARCLVTNDSNVVLYDNFLSVPNTTLRAYDNSEVDYYTGKSIIPVLVRSVGATVSTTRDKITYKIRRVGFKEVSLSHFDMNNPIVFEEMQIEEDFNNTPAVTAITTANELVDMYIRKTVDDMTIPSDILTINGDTIAVLSGWTLKQNPFQTDVIEIDSTNFTISAKFAPAGITKTDRLTRFSGTIDATLNDMTDMLYVESNGKVRLTIENLNPELFNISQLFVVYREVGSPTWLSSSRGLAGVDGSISLQVDPSTEYELGYRVPGYEWKTVTENSGEFGHIVSARLLAHRDLSGLTLYDKTVDEALVNSFAFDLANRRINQTNTTGSKMTIPFTEAYVGIQRAIHNTTTVLVLDNPIYPNPTRNGFIIPDTDPVVFKLTDDSNANVYIDFTMKFTDFEDATDRFIPSTSGHYISFATTAFSLSLPIPSAIDNASAIRTELSTELDRIDENISAEKDVNIKKVNGVAITSIDDFKATDITQAYFNTLMTNTTSTIKDLYKATGGTTPPTTTEIVDAILDAPYGSKSDGMTPLGFGTLGEHWFQFYPPEIIKQLLEYTLDGTTEPTRSQPFTGSYDTGTLGYALREILNKSNQTTVDEIKTEVDSHPTLSEIEASAILAKEQTVSSVETKVDDIPILTEIEASTILAKEATVDSVETKVDAIQTTVDEIPTLEQIEQTTVLAKGSKVEEVKNLSSQIKQATDNMPRG